MLRSRKSLGVFHLGQETGFTMAEMLVALVILSFIFTSFYLIMMTLYDSYASTYANYSTQQKTQIVLIQMMREIWDAEQSVATLDTNGNPLGPVVTPDVKPNPAAYAFNGVVTTYGSADNYLDIYTVEAAGSYPVKVVYRVNAANGATKGALQRAVVSPTNPTAYPFTYPVATDSAIPLASWTTMLPVCNTNLFIVWQPNSTTDATYTSTSSRYLVWINMESNYSWPPVATLEFATYGATTYGTYYGGTCFAVRGELPAS
jgi:prepilin-type N-terminal cleavage/methylation domain-containing protein